MSQPTSTSATDPTVITITTYEEAKDAYRQKSLRQALYDAGEVVMGDVLVNLHAAEHRDRRRLENRLFRRETFELYERHLFPPIIEATLAPDIEAGRAELVDLGHRMMMNLAALTAGIDRPLGTADETRHLYRYLMLFIEGATLAHFTGDQDAKRDEIANELHKFDTEFVTPSLERRAAMLEAGSELPKDVLSVLLANEDSLSLPHDVIVREVAFYLLAGAHTSATAFTRVSHNVLKWLDAHPEDADLVRTDRLFVQRCTHETIRLQPSSPVAMRWALDDIELKSGTHIPRGAKVVIDLLSVNRDPDVFGEGADDFDPHRKTPDGVPAYGLSFGSGMHACIGQDLAAGLLFHEGSTMDDHIFGLVPEAVQLLFDAGVRIDPDDSPEMDESTTRPYFGRYPVLLEAVTA
ncbi:cytochrome P450 [Ilumatobacter sp.]|uniref:cytochrome P450 n=1 Tax=Ilumatobacter sp. TaxID=1967498 RepID=UPI0037500A37